MTPTLPNGYVHHVGARTNDGGIGRRVAYAIMFSLGMLILWALTHRYNGFARDGQLYAVQALARVQPSLAADLYLQNESQDRYTLFSPIYAVFIKVMGLLSAEMLLFSVCTLWFLAASWALVRKLFTADEAWFSLALLILTGGYYGAGQIFSYSENYLTARSLAEALVATALACHFRGSRLLALLVGAAALFVHPLMALPGELLLMCLWFPPRRALILAASGVAALLAFAVVATRLHGSLPFGSVMDPSWLEVVRERSQFLFLEQWGSVDWETTARPFVCLTLAALVIPNPRVHRLCVGAMLVGASGLAVALIAGSIGPVAILLQGQAWRWMWVTIFVSVTLLAPTIVHVWRDERCGPACAALLVLGWTYSLVDSLACVDAALVLWLVRPLISPLVARYLKWAAGATGLVVAVWLIMNYWSFARTSPTEVGRESVVIGRLRDVVGLDVSGVLLSLLVWYGIRSLRSVWALVGSSAVLLAMAVWIIPGSMRQLETVGTSAEKRNFTAWRSAIPPGSTVLLLPTGNSASFMWFTLERPSYLSVSQSAGVVFSRATAAEVRRRSEVLLPLRSPDWKILSSIEGGRAKRSEGAASAGAGEEQKPLTRDTLVHVCGDPVLGFVVAEQDVGLPGLRQEHAGAYKNWYLYDCSSIRRGPSA